MIKLLPSRLRISNFHCSSTRSSMLHSFAALRAKEKSSEATKDSELSVEEALKDLREPEMTEEEIMQKCFKARLPEILYRKFVLKEAVPIQAKYDLDDYRLRKYFARYGRESKLNPGLCYPTREQIREKMMYDKMLEPTLQERMQRVEGARQAEEDRKRKVEAEVDANMANLDRWMSEYHAKIEKKEAKAIELREQRERLVEEISEYLGYDIDPKDPRFKEAVEQRDKEKKKALKVKKQQESYDKMLEKLKQVAQSST